MSLNVNADCPAPSIAASGNRAGSSARARQTAPRRSHPFTPAVVGALAAGLLLAGCGSDSGDGATTPPVATAPPRVLLHGTVSSAVFDELSKQIRAESYDGSQRAADYDLVVLDGDAHTPESLQADTLLAETLRARKPALFVDLTERHKKEGLGSRIGFFTKGTSGGYMVWPRERRDGRTVYRIFGDTPLESLQRPAPNAGSPAPAAAYAGAVLKALQPAASVASQPAASAAPQAAAPLAPRAAASVVPRAGELSDSEPDSPIPSDLINYQWIYTWVGDNYVAYAGKASNRQPQHYNFQINYTINLFLNNKTSAQGDYQYVAVQVDGTENPTYGTGYFYNMAKDEKAWWAGRIHLTLQPENQSTFTWVANDPQTPNAVTTYSANSSFSVGFSGASGTGSYTWGTSKSYDLSQWKVSSGSAGNNMAWDFRSGVPDADQDYGSCTWRDCGAFGTDYPLSPNDLSTGQFTFHASAAYRTSSVATGWTAFDSGGFLQLVDIYCADDFGPTCFKFGAWQTFPVYIAAAGLSINMSAVVPVPIQNISFSQDVAPAGRPVTGTVTLSSPAVVDSSIALQSNSPNATVLPTVTVPAGQTSADFQILTNANGIASGGVSTGTISAFYAQNFQAQVAVKNYASTDLQPPTSYPAYDPQHWAQRVPFGRWVSGYQVRYAVSYLGPNGETDRGPWTPWIAGTPWALPFLVNVPTDPTGRATGRKVYRQFYSDYSSADPSAGLTLIGTLGDNSTTTLQDNSF